MRRAGVCWVVAGTLATACSSGAGSGVVTFGLSDCHGQLVEIARLTSASPLIDTVGVSNNLAIDGDTLFVAYEGTIEAGDLPAAGGIVAVPLSGGTPRLVAAADPAQTSFWTTGSLWAAGGQIYLQDDGKLTALPADPPTASTLTYNDPRRSAYAHDADFAYAALTPPTVPSGVVVQKQPLDGSAPTMLIDETTGVAQLGGMADAGDALLLNLEWRPDPTSNGQVSAGVWRIPKDGSARSEVRPDVQWQDPTNDPQWLAWDGQNVLGPVWVPINRNGTEDQVVEARVAPDGTSAPVSTKLYGTVATTRGDEVLSLQNLDVDNPVAGTFEELLVASSKGAPAGTVVACGAKTPFALTATGIAASDTDIYVAYFVENDTVIARVVP